MNKWLYVKYLWVCRKKEDNWLKNGEEERQLYYFLTEEAKDR